MIRTMRKKVLIVGLSIVIASAVMPLSASAHVVVKPSQATIGAYQVFTTSVPNEKAIPVTGVRLVIPDTVESVTPTVKQGWQIETKKKGDVVTEISWAGGAIDPGLRDEFSFMAHVPSQPGEIHWKAYQTYQDGSVVSWDQKPSDDHAHGDTDKGPYSTTVVKSDAEDEKTHQATSQPIVAYVLGGAALLVSLYAVIRRRK